MYPIMNLQEMQEGELAREKRLELERFSWREKKGKVRRLARLYKKGDYLDYAERARNCATKLQYYAMENGDKQLISANFCHLRLCPMCTARRAQRAAYKLSQILNRVEVDHPGVQFLFLTLTVKNCTGDKLGDAIGQLTAGWNRLMQHKRVLRAVKGWFRAVEITRPDLDEYHPHIHAILAVEQEYGKRSNDLYITQAEWVERWKKALKVGYKPVVHIEKTKEGKGGMGAALEAAKYATKDEDYIDPGLSDEEAVKIVKDYTEALYRRRMTAFGGWMKEIARLYDAGNLDDGDLVHTEPDTIRADIADYIETYEWHFGVGDYILTDRRVNPLKVVRTDA